MADQNHPKYSRFYVEWWNIKRTTIYGIVALVLVFAGIGGGIHYALKNNWFTQQEMTQAPDDAGRLVAFEGDVRIIRADTRETILVTKSTYVAAGDTIQTQADGRATIEMIDGSRLQIRPNSTVVIRDSSSLFGGKNVRVALDQGQLNVRTEDQPENTENVVEVMESENRILPQTDASFNTNPTTNGGEIRISRGGVETNVGGQKTVIKENEFASVNNGKIAAREKLLPAPKLGSPENSAQLEAGANGAIVTYRWQRPETESALKYQLQISKSPYFAPETVLFERDAVVNANYTIGDIPPGTFYWRLRAGAVSGQTSDWSEPWKFTVNKQRSGNEPIAASGWKVETVGGSVYKINGMTQPGATVRAQGRETFARGDGSFSLQISSGLSQTVVEIGDENGNRSSYALNLRTGAAVRQ